MSGEVIVLYPRGVPEGFILRAPLGEMNQIFDHQSPGNELPGYYPGAPPGLTISDSLIILTPMGRKGL